MANYDELKAAIRAAIYENTEQEITGDALQGILLEMVDDLNAGKADDFTASAPLRLEDGDLSLSVGGGLLVNADGELVAHIGGGLDFGHNGELQVDYSAVWASLTIAAPLEWNGDDLTVLYGSGLALNSDGELVVDTTVIQEKLGALSPISISDGDIELSIDEGLRIIGGSLVVDFENDIAGNPSVTDKAVNPKAVADYVDGILGDIQTLLEAI